LGIVPRQIKPEGYVDLDHDSPKEGSIIYFFEAASQKQRQEVAAEAEAKAQTQA